MTIANDYFTPNERLLQVGLIKSIEISLADAAKGLAELNQRLKDIEAINEINRTFDPRNPTSPADQAEGRGVGSPSD